MKTCSKCRVEKPLEDFNKSSSSKDGRQYTCRDCARAAALKWNEEHPEKVAASVKKWQQSQKGRDYARARREGPLRERILEQKRAEHERNREKRLAYNFERQRDPEKAARAREASRRWAAAHPRHAENRSLMRLYGIGIDEWDALLIAQSGRCAICLKVMVEPHTDHDHATGKVRGLLCTNCNRALGFFHDSSDLRAAIVYLSQ